MSTNATFVATAPSNIAFLKYWGKSDVASQWPTNDSLSMTLSSCKTTTRVSRQADGPHTVVWQGRHLAPDDKRATKILAHCERLLLACQKQTSLAIETENSFPEACGIASSASGFAALTVAATAAILAAKSFNELEALGFDRPRLAALARLGSGSACRSLFGGYVAWRRGSASDDQTVAPVAAASEWQLSDIIVIASDAAKAVGSTEAHARVHTSPLFAARFAALPEVGQGIAAAIRDRDLARLGPLLEEEALSIHSVIATAEPPIRYLGETTGSILAWLRTWRRDARVQAYFTLDAGPNVHIICERKDTEVVAAAVARAFSTLAIVIDGVGDGPTLTVEE